MHAVKTDEFSRRNRWRNTPKNVVIVHGLPPATILPNASPFVLKVETYLRLAKIPYQVRN